MTQASAEKLEQTGPADKKRVASVQQSERLARTSKPPLPKKKEQSHQSTLPDGDVQISQDEQEPQPGEKEVYQSGSMWKIEWTSQ